MVAASLVYREAGGTETLFPHIPSHVAHTFALRFRPKAPALVFELSVSSRPVKKQKNRGNSYVV